MNPDDRGRWFENGELPARCNAISLSAVYSTAKLFRDGRFHTIKDPFGLLGERSAREMLSVFNYSEMGRTDYSQMYVYELSIPGFTLALAPEAPRYEIAAQLQARLYVTNFSTTLLAAESSAVEATTIPQWYTVIENITEAIDAMIAKYGADAVDFHISSGVNSVALMQNALEFGIDADLALEI